jgi:PilZ domain-containing protein
MPKNHQFILAGFKVDRKLLLNFADSFKRLNASILTVHLQSGQGGDCREINACVLPLGKTAVAWLKKAPWFLPRRTVVYGIGGAREATRFVALGINALLETSSDASIRAAVEATQSLLSHGIGECGRVPIVTLVRIDAQGRTLTGITKNVGYGGMAVRLFRNVALPQEITVNFVLPYARSFSLAASPSWYSGRLVGLRFQPSVQEEALRRWVHDYSFLGRSDGQSLRARCALA